MNKSDFVTKLKKFFKYIMPEIAIILGGIIVDLVSKAIVEHTMEPRQSVVLIPKFLNISYTTNDRAAFGSDFGLGNLLGDGGVMAFFIIVTVLAVGFFGFLLFKKPKKGMLFRVAFSLIIAGAIGNLYDRVFLGEVRDFIEFEYFGLTIFGQTHFAIFNIADSCVVVGAILLAIYFIFFDPSLKLKPKKEAQAANAESGEAEAEGEADKTEIEANKSDDVTKVGQAEESEITEASTELQTEQPTKNE